MKHAVTLLSVLCSLAAAAKPTRNYAAAWGNGLLKPGQFAEIIDTSAA